MKGFRLFAIVVVGFFVLYAKFTTSSSAPGAAPSFGASGGNSQVDAVPQKALEVLQIVRSTGQPPEGYVGGRVFQNREGRLPADGDYREFDVDPHNGGRNAERIIVEWNTKKAWYTSDHYQTFTPLP
jgi:guanyl-specific ribonuclease Sa